MQDIIRLLPDSVANQIAAGEVIQQPSSVIKELVENSIDAGASKIDIFIKDAGRTLIQVIDNGCGMTPTDLRLAFERHSTSKIREASDLFSLTTMGFRGEALASIAAISQLDVRSMPQDSTMGTRILINGSKVESQNPEVTSAGTNFMVKNLFFNVPARRKFLKKDSIEFTNILHEFERLALVNPTIELSLYHNDVLIHSLGRGNLKSRIGELFGRTIEDSLVAVDCHTSLVDITGFVGTPSSARKRGALQYFFVNGRNMKHPYFRKAVVGCYEKLIPIEAQPNYFINFNIDPQSIDVNIHPTKNEIKFDNEQSIWQILNAAVKEALGRFNLAPSLNFDNPVNIDILPPQGTLRRDNYFAKTSLQSPSYNPFRSNDVDAHLDRKRLEVLGWEQLYHPSVKGEPSPIIDQSAEYQSSGNVRFLQIGGKFVLVPSTTGLYIINQREAHIRVLYESYLKNLENKAMKPQNLLFTNTIILDDTQSLILNSIIDNLFEAGFILEHLENNEWEIKAIPTDLGGTDGREIILDILTQITEETNESEDPVMVLQKNMALQMAKVSAIRYGQQLSEAEVEHLVSNLFSTTSPSLSPTGAVIIVNRSLEDIESLF